MQVGLYIEKVGIDNATIISFEPLVTSSFDMTVIDKTMAKLDVLISSNGTDPCLFDLKSTKYRLGKGIQLMREDALLHMWSQI